MIPEHRNLLCPNCAKVSVVGLSNCPYCLYTFESETGMFGHLYQDLLGPKDMEGVVNRILKLTANQQFEDSGFLIQFLIDQKYMLDSDYQKIGRALHALHKDAMALVCCEKAVHINPQDPKNHHALAECYQVIGVHDKAQYHAQEAIHLEPFHAGHRFLLADVFDTMGQFTQAAKEYLYGMALGNTYGKGFDHIVDETLDLQQLEEYHRELTKQHDQSHVIHFAMGNLFKSKMMYDKAEVYYQKALSVRPEDTQTINRLADVYLKQNKVDEALEQFKRVLTLDDKNIESLRSLGRLHKEKSQWQEALLYFERVLTLNSRDSNAAYEAKEMYRKLSNPQRAIQIMKEYQISDPGFYNWAMHHIFEILYYDLRDDKQLCDLVEKTYPNKVSESFVYDYFGYSLMNLGRLEEAVKSFERFLELEPKNARVMRELGRVFCDLQRYQQAIEVLTKSFAIESKNSYGYYYLALAYHKLGKDDLARKTLQEGKQFDPAYKWFDDLLTEIDPGYQAPIHDGVPQDLSGTGVVESSGVPNFLRDLTQLAQENKVDDIYGRDAELQEIIEVLCRRSKANPLIVGQPGVGKTVLVNGLAHRISRGEVPDILQSYRLFELEVFAVVAGTRYVGTLEQKFMQLAQFCRQNKVIIFIDELHTLMGAGSYSSHETGGLDEMFKPLMTQPDFKLIGATTDEEYQQNISKSGAFERRFTRITVLEPIREDTMKVLESLRQKLEPFYNISLQDKALRTTYDLADKYIKTRYFPDKACDILERASIKASLERTKDDKSTKEVTDQHLVQAVSQVSRIPDSSIHIDAMGSMLNLEEKLKARVIGQDDAVFKVSEVVRMTKSGLDVNPERPDGVFLFIGPTGVGKTELAKALAEALEGSEKRLVRIDMSEYNDSHALSKLIGTAPGFVGYEDEGRLTRAVREDPSAVILLDEIEKAHPKIYEMFLQVFDDGRLTDGKGQTVSFSHTTMIMTSNLGAEHIYGKSKMGFGSEQTDAFEEVSAGIRESLKKHFSPEFLNRIDEIVVFRALDEAMLVHIARQKIDAIIRRFDDKDIRIHVDNDVIELCVQGLDLKRQGARGLNRSLEDKLSRPLSRVMISNPDCRVFTVQRHEDQIVILRGN